jgi:hypothetical protein
MHSPPVRVTNSKNTAGDISRYKRYFEHRGLDMVKEVL